MNETKPGPVMSRWVAITADNGEEVRINMRSQTSFFRILCLIDLIIIIWSVSIVKYNIFKVKY